MDVLLFILAALFMFVGILGSVLPALPGLPLNYIGLLLIHFTDRVQFTTEFLLIWLGVVIVVSILDNVVPMFTTKAFGGSKYAMWGSVIGLLFGMFIPPIGIVLGTLLGAVVGELIAGKELGESLKAGFGAFVGFMLTTGAKLICCGFMLYYYIDELVRIII